MREAYDRIKEGLNEALAFAQGEKTGAVVHRIAVPRDHGPFAEPVRQEHRCCQGHVAQLGAWPQAADGASASAARDDRAQAIVGAGIAGGLS
jgi:hypothetical protein